MEGVDWVDRHKVIFDTVLIFEQYECIIFLFPPEDLKNL